MIDLTNSHVEELLQRLQLVLYRRAALDKEDAFFASALVERLVGEGPGIVLDVRQWARIERLLGSPGDPAEADVPLAIIA